MDGKISLVRWIPLASAVLAATLVASYMLSGLIAEERLGRPSSTAAIGYLFVPVYSFVGALAGLGLGFVLRLSLRNQENQDLISPTAFLLLLLTGAASVSGIAAWLAIDRVVAYEKANAVHILSDTGHLKKEIFTRDGIPSITTRAAAVWSYDEPEQPPFVWNGKGSTVRVTDSTYMTIDIDGQSSPIQHDFRGRTYVTEIDVLPVQWAHEQPDYLAVLVRLRATSSRSMLLIYDADGSLLYEELLERCGPKERQYMGTVSDLEGTALIVNVCVPFSLTLKAT